MKKAYLLSAFTFIILFIGGCWLMSEKDISEMDPKDLPNVTAFQDDFTREFMTSTEEVDDGYYLFESKTGGYTMWYPEDAVMNKGYFERTKDTYERVSFGREANKDKSNIPYYVVATYDHFHKGKESERLLNLLSKYVNYDGEYEEFTHNTNTIFLAKSKSTTRNQKVTWYEFFGLVKANSSNQSLRYIYSVECKKQSDDCSYDFDAIEQKVREIMKSVEFKDVELEEG